jgi:hypothetical protein
MSNIEYIAEVIRDLTTRALGKEAQIIPMTKRTVFVAVLESLDADPIIRVFSTAAAAEQWKKVLARSGTGDPNIDADELFERTGNFLRIWEVDAAA